MAARRTGPRARTSSRASPRPHWPGRDAARSGWPTSCARCRSTHRLRVKVGLREDEPPCRRVTPLFPTATGTSARSSTSTAIVFDGHPDLTPDPAAGRTGRGIPLRKDEPLGGRAHVVPRRDHAAGRRAGDGVSDASSDAGADDRRRGDIAGLPRPGHRRVRQETMIINMGPQHPSTHGVLRLLLELDGETVIRCKPVDRLPAHRHREEHRVPHLGAGRHVRDARRLPVAVLQRAGVLPGGRAAARHRGSRRARS